MRYDESKKSIWKGMYIKGTSVMDNIRRLRNCLRKYPLFSNGFFGRFKFDQEYLSNMVKLVVELVYKGNRNRISRYLRSNLGLCRKTLVKGFRYRRSKERKRRARKLALKAFKARGFPKHLFQKLRRRLNNKLARILYKKKRGFECNVWKFSQLIRWWKRNKSNAKKK